MKKLVRGTVPLGDFVMIVNDVMKKWRAGDPEIRSALSEIVASDNPEIVREAFINHLAEEKRAEEVWINNLYQVTVRRHEMMVHLSIRRQDRGPVRDWRDVQEIKNQLVGPENEGVELYPAESRLVDTANQFHCWVVADPTFRFPFGFPNRVVTQKSAITPIASVARKCDERISNNF